MLHCDSSVPPPASLQGIRSMTFVMTETPSCSLAGFPIVLFLVGRCDCPRGTTGCTPPIFRLDALALSVIATATWLGGWVAGWLSVTAGIVSKQLNLSQNFLHHLVAPSFKHLGPLTPIPNSKGNPFIGGVKYRGGDWRFSLDFRRTSPFISETVRDRPMVTMER